MQIGRILLVCLCYFTMMGIAARGEPSAQTVIPNGVNVTLQTATATSQGIQATVQLQHVDVLSANIQSVDPGTNQLNPFLNIAEVPLPTGLRDTPNAASGTISIPVTAPDSTKTYQLTLFAYGIGDTGGTGARASGNPASVSNGQSFKGYSAPSLKAITLTFNATTLTVSVQTDSVMTLTSSWKVASGQVGTQSLTQQNPHVDLTYADLAGSATPGNLPAIDVKLSDNSGTVQESLITPAVALTSSAAAKVQQAQTKPNNKTFSWSDLAGGVATLVKFFAK